MGFLRFVVVFGLLGAVAAEAHAAVEVTLRHAMNEHGKRLDGEGIVEVVLKNTGKQSVFIDPWTLPATSPRNGLMLANVFQVTSPNGASAQYRGYIADRGGEPGYKELPPAGSAVYTISIALNYEILEAGIHRVEFSGVQYLRLHRESYVGLTASTISEVMLEAGTGEAIDMHLTPSLKNEEHSLRWPQGSDLQQCSEEQLQQFTEETRLASAALATMRHLNA